MKLKTLIKVCITTGIGIFCAPIVSANNIKLPDTCPIVEAVQTESTNFKIREYEPGSGVWFAHLNSKFATEAEWTFMIGDIHAKNALKAYKKFIEAITRLYFKDANTAVDGTFVKCRYTAGRNIYASAITPPRLIE